MYDTRAMSPGEQATEAAERLAGRAFREDFALSPSDPVPPAEVVAGGLRGHGGAVETLSDESAETYVVAGVTIKVKHGPSALLLLNAALDFHDLVERLEDGQCWGLGQESRTSDGKITAHGDGTAVCLNARWHRPSERTMTPMQAALCRAIAGRYGLTWGGDDTQIRRVSQGHFEFGGNIEQAEAKVEELRATPAVH